MAICQRPVSAPASGDTEITLDLESDIPFSSLYHRFGRLYPIRRSKKPLSGRRPLTHAARPNEYKKLSNWLRHEETAGWALRIESPQLAIIDCEHPNKHTKPGPDGILGFDEFCQSLGVNIPPHLSVRSGSGGIQSRLLLPAGFDSGGPVRPWRLLAAWRRTSFLRQECHHARVSEADTDQGPPGYYEVIAGADAGIVEIPRALALALIQTQGLRAIQSLGDGKRRTPRKSCSGRRRNPTAKQDADTLPVDVQLASKADYWIRQLRARNRIFRNLDNHRKKEAIRLSQLI
jgi:hypothetical protein